MNRSQVMPPSRSSYLLPRTIREHEILRIVANIAGNDKSKSAQLVREKALQWAARKTVGRLPQEASNFESFDHYAVGRTCTGIRLRSETMDIWALRSEEPDKNIADRVWTTEITVTREDELLQFTLRLLASSREDRPDIEPATPVLVRMLASAPGLAAGEYSISSHPIIVRSEDDVDALIARLIDPLRKLPVFVLSVSAYSPEEEKPLLDANKLAESMTGIAHVVILPSRSSWILTNKLGRPLSVYEGAVRTYLPGFGPDSDPFVGHELILPNRLASPEGRSEAVRRMKWLAATQSIRRNALGADVRSISTLRAVESEYQQLLLDQAGASDREKLDAARIRIKALEDEVRAEQGIFAAFTQELEDSTARANSLESQLHAAGFRIQQLTAQVRNSGQAPDQNIGSPTSWSGFVEWCDSNLAGRIMLSSLARRELDSPLFEDPSLVSRCLLWLANDYRDMRLEGGDGSLRDFVLEEGVRNSPCGGDSYKTKWQGKWTSVDWHIKNGGNTREPRRCMRIYYFWDESLQQVIVDSAPSHRPTSGS